ncbi:MAG TPA: hypothetical protein VMV83_04275 [Rectinemataceae bacterium]|nr:hypothetical protein [Rectinemataceae bacterium]
MPRSSRPWVLGSVLSSLLLLFSGIPISAQIPNLSPASLRNSLLEALSTSGSFSIAPFNNWASGDMDALSDSFFGYATPRVNQLSVTMDRTASTTYEGGLFFKKLKLRVGLDVDVDSNFVGKLNRLMGYLGYDIFEVRVETSGLKGTATWLGSPQGGMPAQSSFDNPFISVDLLYFLAGSGGIDYLGLGYMSYRLPVQLDCLTYDTSRASVWWAPVVSFYQPDMAFGIYSVILGVDSLHSAIARRGVFGQMQGFAPWLWTQDRAGAGISTIGADAQAWIENANHLPLWSATQIPMLVDYNLTLGLQWVGGLGRLRLGFGLGYNIGGQTLTCITPKGTVDSSHVDASPSVYLVHYGPVLKASLEF